MRCWRRGAGAALRRHHTQRAPTDTAAANRVSGGPGELKAIAQFLLDCAAEMERVGADYDHLHLSDHIAQFETAPQFVVAAATLG
ncbi:Imm32 family immunity protein [Xanthomonas rydalmerensis]|uniref:Imm32 family immunity protein n=1 Tax=Xanthomonas rydalmerensis TaxID=3046274 RepID=UPI001ECA5CB1|nr:hypothetical protein [Xanthomonas sp. LMG 9002]